MTLGAQHAVPLPEKIAQLYFLERHAKFPLLSKERARMRFTQNKETGGDPRRGFRFAQQAPPLHKKGLPVVSGATPDNDFFCQVLDLTEAKAFW
jgi:hypothetical protein